MSFRLAVNNTEITGKAMSIFKLIQVCAFLAMGAWLYRLVEGNYGFWLGATAFVIGVFAAWLLWQGFWKVYDHLNSKK